MSDGQAVAGKFLAALVFLWAVTLLTLPMPLLVMVNGEEVEMSENNGWSYDDEGCLLQFHGDAVPERDSEIVAEYVIQSGATCD